MKKKKIKAWGGISNNTIAHWEGKEYGFEEAPMLKAIFRSKKEAKKRFARVVPVEIIIKQ